MCEAGWGFVGLKGRVRWEWGKDKTTIGAGVRSCLWY